MHEIRPTPSCEAAVAGRLAALRATLADQGLDGFILPHADEHQNEWLPARAERLAWLTGFTGSAGAAVVLDGEAAVFVDGRYTVQVRNETDEALFSPQHLIQTPPGAWIAAHAPASAAIGYDPWLHTLAEIEALERKVAAAGIRLVALDENPIDTLWVDRPPAPRTPVEPHSLVYTGRESAQKRGVIAGALAGEGGETCVLTLPESIAWLLNIRGRDLPHMPVVLAYALLHADASVDLFIEESRVDAAERAHLGDAVTLRPPAAFAPALAALGARHAHVRACPHTAPARVFALLEGAEISRAPDPCLLPKAIKNETELAGARAAHRRDGAALTRFLAWLAREAPRGGVSEKSADGRLEALRRESDLFRDLSFDTISGAGAHGAIVHYRVTRDSDQPLRPGALYLVDSGAQYPDGTTDVTRTVAIGAPDPAIADEARTRFTRVLKGHIALARVRFPEGATGAQLDTLARQHLWRAGLDYDHGTGHGIGSYLGVHEGPQRISKGGDGTPLAAGMIVSNEPGYYKEGAYGIRIENLVAVVAATPPPGAERNLLALETLTLAPIDRALIDVNLLAPEEIAWLDGYHARVDREIGPLVDAETRAWLAAATRPLKG